MDAAKLKNINSNFVKTNDRHQAGLACVASLVNYYGGLADIRELYNNSGAAQNGVNLLGLCRAAQIEGFEANGFKADIDAIKGLEDPAILHISKDSGDEDYIVLYGWLQNKFIVGDPQWGIIEYREDELSAIWKSNALMLMQPGDLFVSKKERLKLKRKSFFKLIDGHKRVLWVLGIFALISSALSIAFLRYLINNTELIFEFQDKQLFLQTGVVIVVSLLCLLIVNHFRNTIYVHGKKSLIIELNKLKVESIFKRKGNGEKVSMVQMNSFEDAVKQFCVSIFKAITYFPFYGLLLLVSLIIISIHSLLISTILILGLILTGVLMRLGRKKVDQFSKAEISTKLEKDELVYSKISNWKSLLLLNRNKEFVSNYTDRLKESRDAKADFTLFKYRVNNWFAIGSVVIIFLVFVILFFSESRGLKNNWISLIVWLSIYLISVYKLAFLYADFGRAQISYDTIYEKVGKNILYKKKRKVKKVSELFPIKKLTVENLEFAFPGQAPVFQDVNFEAELGKITIIKGAPGSGKSVLVSILNRLLPMHEGEIKINDKSWFEISNILWRKNTSSVQQPVTFLGETVIENIGAGAETFNAKKIISFCKENGFDRFIKELPNAYSTPVENLSAGQKQLITICSAVYRKPVLLLLDEPFVYMDKRMSDFCYKLLETYKNEMLIIIFSNSVPEGVKEGDFIVHKLVNYNFG
jgi:ABC-type bacteriocin/lantibiotic exporter with double-glycine peptidase domain